MWELRWHHQTSGAETKSATGSGPKKRKLNGTHRIVAVIFAGVILWCTMVVLLGTANAIANEPLGADTSAGTISETDVGSLQMLAGDSFLAAQSAPASTIYVDVCPPEPGPFTTLSDAVTAASPGDTIVIQCGVYAESLVIGKQLTLTASGGSAVIGAEPDHLWAGTNNGDIFDEPDAAEDPDKTLGAMLDELVAADLRVLRIYIDYRLELDDEGNAKPIGEYSDCILEAIDDLMVEAKQRGILLLVTLQGFNWIEQPYSMSVDFYSWRRCKTPANLYAELAADPDWEGGDYPSPYQQRTANLGWGNFFSDEQAKDAYRQRVSHILHHRNPYLDNREWKDINDVVWAWELFGEPEHLVGVDDLIPWLDEMGTYVKGIDPDTYLALGTKIDQQQYFELLDHNFVDVDIYTMHAYGPGGVLEWYIDQFNSPEGVGGQYGKLLFIEEFTPYRSPSGYYNLTAFENYIEDAERVNTPWMWWEYGYNTDYAQDDDDVWHSGPDAELWNTIIVPHATDMWNTPRPCACKRWRVGEMVDALSPP
jgi:hypothetical protein